MVRPLQFQLQLVVPTMVGLLLFLLLLGCVGGPSNEESTPFSDEGIILPDTDTSITDQGLDSTTNQPGDVDMGSLSPLVINGVINGAFQREGNGDLPEWFVFSFPNWYVNEHITEWKTYGKYPSILTIDPAKPHGIYLPDEQNPEKIIFEDASGKKTAILFEPVDAESVRMNGVLYKRKFATKLHAKLGATPQERYAAAGPAFPDAWSIQGTYGVILSTNNGDLYMAYNSFTPTGLYGYGLKFFPWPSSTQYGGEGVSTYTLAGSDLTITHLNGAAEKVPFAQKGDTFPDSALTMTFTEKYYDPTFYNMYHAYVWKTRETNYTYHRVDYPYDGYVLSGKYQRSSSSTIQAIDPNLNGVAASNTIYTFTDDGIVVLSSNAFMEAQVPDEVITNENDTGQKIGQYLILGNVLTIAWEDGTVSSFPFNLVNIQEAESPSPPGIYVNAEYFKYAGPPTI